MRKLLPTVLLLACCLLGIQRITENSSQENAKSISFRGTSFSVYTCNIEEEELRFFWKSANKKLYNLGAVEQLVKQQYKAKLSFATNAGMYTPLRDPQGLYVEEGKELSPIDLANGNGNFYLKPNGIFLIEHNGTAQVVESSKYHTNTEKVKFATQSGPLLLIDNQIHLAFNEGSANKYIRSGVGILADKKVVFAISQQPVNFYDFALLFKEKLGCKDALYLDGAISRAYIPALNKLDKGGEFGAMIGCFKK